MKMDALLSEQRLRCMLYSDHVECVIQLGEPIDEALLDVAHPATITRRVNSVPRL